MTAKRKDTVITPEKRKGSFAPTRRWWDAICGGVVGAILTGAAVHIHEFSEVRAYPSLVGGLFVIFGLMFLLIVGIFAANAYYNPPQELPELRQNPNNPSVIQQWDGQAWHDSLTVLPASLEVTPVPLIPPDKAKSAPARPSLLWIALVAAATSLYSLFLSRPPRD